MRTELILDRVDRSIIASTTQDVEPILERNKALRGESQRHGEDSSPSRTAQEKICRGPCSPGEDPPGEARTLEFAPRGDQCSAARAMGDGR
jgi:hypothetical protein